MRSLAVFDRLRHFMKMITPGKAVRVLEVTESNIHTSKENKNDAVSLNQGWLLLMRTGRVVLALIVNAPEGHTGTHVSCGRWIFANK